MAVGAIEPQFFAELLAGLGLSAAEVPGQLDNASYARLPGRLASFGVVAVRASREILIDAPPEVILEALADVGSVPSWWSSAHKRSSAPQPRGCDDGSWPLSAQIVRSSASRRTASSRVSSRLQKVNLTK